MTLHGGCHCGALQASFETARTIEELGLRECQCSFCRKHGAVNTSDPAGHVRIVAERAALIRYRFALRTADFFICARCGVYVGCVLDDAFASLNMRALVGAPVAPATPYDFGGESAGDRVDRRRTRWTPCTVELT
jgi:hypothetical protein